MVCICEILLDVNLKGTDRLLDSQGEDNGYLGSRWRGNQFDSGSDYDAGVASCSVYIQVQENSFLAEQLSVSQVESCYVELVVWRFLIHTEYTNYVILVHSLAEKGIRKHNYIRE
jgi:hypothetical protein